MWGSGSAWVCDRAGERKCIGKKSIGTTWWCGGPRVREEKSAGEERRQMDKTQTCAQCYRGIATFAGTRRQSVLGSERRETYWNLGEKRCRVSWDGRR